MDRGLKRTLTAMDSQNLFFFFFFFFFRGTLSDVLGRGAGKEGEEAKRKNQRKMTTPRAINTNINNDNDNNDRHRPIEAY